MRRYFEWDALIVSSTALFSAIAIHFGFVIALLLLSISVIFSAVIIYSTSII